MIPRRQLLRTLPAFALLGCRDRAPREVIAKPPGAPSRLLLARVYTNDPARPWAEGVLMHDGEIVAVGTKAELEARADAQTERITWPEVTVLPGLTDAHAHLLGLGQGTEIVDLRGASSVDEVISRLRAGAPAKGWILGRGWDQNLWGGEMPTATQLDQAFADRPVWLRRVDGHAGWANSALLEAAGLDASATDPEGGELLRGADGRSLRGVLVDAAMDLVPVPAPTPADIERWLRLAMREAASVGLTGVHEMGLGADAHAVFARLAQDGQLPLRVHGYASEAWWDAGLDGLGRVAPNPAAAARYFLAGVKVYADGALGSRGAALLEPYADRPDHAGALMHPPAYFVELFTAILARGLQVATHAIGDLGNRTTIEAYAAALAATELDWEPRLRIEHLQIVDPRDIPRMAELGLVASMQPTHATSDMPWVPARIGAARLPGAYAWRRVLEAGVPLAFGSDFPVERPSPLLGLYAAITRQDLAGAPPRGWLPDQRVSLAEAIAGFSSGAAHAAHRETQLGRIAPGYRADLTCLEGDPFALAQDDPVAITQLAVRSTFVDGTPTP